MAMTVAQVVAALGLIGTISGGVYFAEDRYSKKSEVNDLTQRVSEPLYRGLKALTTRIDKGAIRDDIRDYERRILRQQIKTGREDCGPRRDICAGYQRQIEKLERQLEK